MGEISLNYVLTTIFVSLFNQTSNIMMSRMCMSTFSRCGIEIGETNSCQPPPKMKLCRVLLKDPWASDTKFCKVKPLCSYLRYRTLR